MIKICKQHVILSSVIISIFLVFLLRWISWKCIFDQPYANWMTYITRTLVCVGLIGLLRIGKNGGFQKKGFLKSLLYGIPFYVIGIGSAILSNWGTDMTSLQIVSWNSVFIFTITILLVSINEEIWLRALVLNLLSTKFDSTRRDELKAVLISAFIFGVMHLSNLPYMDIINVMVQMINACAGGILFGAIYVKTRNIWGLIVIHFLVNWISLAIGECFVGTSTILSVQMTPLVIIVSILGGVFVPVISACVIMKGNSNKE